MKCPHCSVSFKAQSQRLILGGDEIGSWYVEYQECANCDRFIIWLGYDKLVSRGGPAINVGKQWVSWPRTASRGIDTTDVPEHILSDYHDACEVISISPKASAALSRRILQILLRDHGKVKSSNLDSEITEFIAQPGVPSDISASVDAVRIIGNFSAHPIKSKTTGEIVDVEPGEAEWNLETIELLFDFFFTRPKLIQDRKQRLNEKLKDAGKPELK